MMTVRVDALRRAMDAVLGGTTPDRGKWGHSRTTLARTAPSLRVLEPSGYVAMWADKFLLCSSGVSHFFGDALKVVDLITWDKGRIGMGYRSH